MIIRKAEKKDMEELLKLYARARAFMKETGNPNQWKDSYPQPEVVEKGIQEGKAYVALAEGPEESGEEGSVQKGEILGTFYFAIEEDPSYQRIEGGSWLNAQPYGVIHRVASSGRGKGFSAACFAWAAQQCLKAGCGNLRIDTHEDNRVMQHVLEKNGFSYCGRIYLADGSPRLAYQKILG